MWYVYLLRVSKDRSLYCGISNDLEARIKTHQMGKGAKYLRGKGNIELVWFMSVANRSIASKIEIAIKRMPKKDKEVVVSQAPRVKQTLLELLS